jgi:PAS domain S-box-containing protein
LKLNVELEERLQFEALIADLSSTFVNVPADKVDSVILDAQRRVCEFLGLNLSTLWQWKEGTRRYLTLSHLYRPLGGPPLPEQIVADELFPWCTREASEGRTVVVESTEVLPREAAQDQATWRHYGVKSSVVFPLSPGGEALLGALSFNSMRQQRAWPEPLLKRLELIAQIFANALARARADKALRESEERLELAADAAALGLWSLNLATGHFWLTNKARQLFALPATEEITFARFLSLVHPEDQRRLQEKVRTMAESKQEDQIEYRVVRSDGSSRWMSSRGRVQCNAAGEPDSLMGVTADVTQRKQAEQQAQELRNNLAHLTRVNTLGALSGSLAHELNHPLAIILSNAQAAQDLLAQDPPDIAEVQAILADVVAADRRASEVIDRLRALLKRGETSLQPLDLNKVIDQALRLIQSDLIGRGVTVAHDLAPDLPPALGDRVQLQQLILNLVLNAADAVAGNAPGARRVHLHTGLQQGCLRVSVRDEGKGLPADTEQLFQPFYTTKPHGLGIGLVICRFIADAHRGRLWAEPHPERGAVFHFEIPVVTGPLSP